MDKAGDGAVAEADDGIVNDVMDGAGDGVATGAGHDAHDDFVNYADYSDMVAADDCAVDIAVGGTVNATMDNAME